MTRWQGSQKSVLSGQDSALPGDVICRPEGFRLRDCRYRWSSGCVQSREIEKLDCVLSKRAIRLHIYGYISADVYVRIYV